MSMHWESTFMHFRGTKYVEALLLCENMGGPYVFVVHNQE